MWRQLRPQALSQAPGPSQVCLIQEPSRAWVITNLIVNIIFIFDMILQCAQLISKPSRQPFLAFHLSQRQPTPTLPQLSLILSSANIIPSHHEPYIPDNTRWPSPTLYP